MDVIEPSHFQAVQDSLINQLRIVGLGVLTNDGGGWVDKKHVLCGWFSLLLTGITRLCGFLMRPSLI